MFSEIKMFHARLSGLLQPVNVLLQNLYIILMTHSKVLVVKIEHRVRVLKSVELTLVKFLRLKLTQIVLQRNDQELEGQAFVLWVNGALKVFGSNPIFTSVLDHRLGG